MCNVNECVEGTHNCHSSATCQNTQGSFSCGCVDGFQGNGVDCTDIDECSAGTHNCDVNAACTNSVGSFSCSCDAGFRGDGTTCADIDECAEGSHDCHADATCLNTPGSFSCSCNYGTEGNGTVCIDICSDTWTYYEESCYLSSREVADIYSRDDFSHTTWTSARTTCQALRGDLAVTPDSAEQDWVRRHMMGTFHWIGLGADAVTWVDGTAITDT
ncbi:uromodulin-like [Branchiostoma floridae]|uniref:Uromodulin-like n=1 Tax=Branchiostoma floridae TaxID=7739 RepID=A0A9J7MMD5_BRAFL|nr:uromodulin-like [Branchiostoma floridae]